MNRQIEIDFDAHQFYFLHLIFHKQVAISIYSYIYKFIYIKRACHKNTKHNNKTESAL